MTCTNSNLKISSQDRWVSLPEIKNKVTYDGVQIAQNVSYDEMFTGGYKKLPLTFKNIQPASTKTRKTHGLHKDNKDQILRKYLKSGESENLEFKSSLRYDVRQKTINRSLEKPIIKTITAFLNSGGGVLIIGVDDDGTVLGIEPDLTTLQRPNRDGFTQVMVNMISSSVGIEYCSFIDISFGIVDNQTISVIKVDKSTQPVFIREGENREFYVRMGTVTKLLNSEETFKYINLHW